MGQSPRPIRVGTNIQKVTSELIKDGPRSSVIVSGIWTQVVGKNLARCSAVIGVSRQTLSVAVRSEQIQKELRYLQTHILHAVSRCFSGFSAEKLEIFVDSEFFSGKSCEDSPPTGACVRVFGSEEKAMAKKVCAVIPDSELRAVFETWMCMCRSTKQINGLS